MSEAPGVEIGIVTDGLLYTLEGKSKGYANDIYLCGAGGNSATVSPRPANVDYQMIAEHARLIVDTRGVMRKVRGPLKGRLVQA